jgi:hypothetical protein
MLLEVKPGPVPAIKSMAANQMSFRDMQLLLASQATGNAVHAFELQSPSCLGGSSFHKVDATVEERGRMWFIRLSNLHWNVVQPLFLDVLELEWTALIINQGCLCKRIHSFCDLDVYCVCAIKTRSNAILKLKHDDTMWENICQADPATKGKVLLGDHFDITNIDKFYRLLRLCDTNGADSLAFLRHHATYKQYMAPKIPGGGLLSMRNFASHERRLRKWNSTDFDTYAKKMVALCQTLAVHLYKNALDARFVHIDQEISRCLNSTIDLDMERLVFDLACKMVRYVCVT